MLLPVAEVTLPTLLNGAVNGQLNDALLDEVQPGIWLMRDAAKSFLVMRDAARADGVDLVIQFGYRDYATQKSIFLSRYVPEYLTGHETVVWNGQRYWKLSGVATAAIPGTSNHGWGLAIDLENARTASTPVARWLIAHAHEYGWSAELQSESWHWRRHAGNYTDPQPEEDDMTLDQLAQAFGGALDTEGRIVVPLSDGQLYPLGNVLGFIHGELTRDELLPARIRRVLGS